MNIAVKLPNNLEEIIYAFPFLHKLSELFKNENANIHLITGSEEIGVLNLLPFKAFFYQLDKSDVESSLRVVRAYKNSKLNLQEYEHYISLTDFKSDILLGKILKAKNIIAFEDTGFDFLINSKVRKLKGRKKTEQFYKLLSALDEIDENNIRNMGSREFEIAKDLNEYIVLDSELLESDDWIEFINLFDQDRVVIYGEAPKEYTDFKIIAKRNYIEFSKLLYLSKGFITSNYEYALLGAYTGAATFYLETKLNMDEAFEFFIGKAFKLSLDSSDYQDAEDKDYGQIFDFIYDKIPTSLKERK